MSIVCSMVSFTLVLLSGLAVVPLDVSSLVIAAWCLSLSSFCCYIGTAALYNNKKIFFSSRSLWWGMCWDVGPAPTLAISCRLWALLWWGICRDIGPTPTLAIFCGLWVFWLNVCQAGHCEAVHQSRGMFIYSCMPVMIPFTDFCPFKGGMQQNEELQSAVSFAHFLKVSTILFTYQITYFFLQVFCSSYIKLFII